MNKVYGWVMVLASVFFTACTMPETKIYSLYVPVDQVQLKSGGDESIIILLKSARHLSQPYIASRNSPYRIDISKYARWDSAPGKMINEKFHEFLRATGLFKEVRTGSRIIPEGFYAFEITLESFERIDDSNGYFGELVFDARLLSPGGDQLYSAAISKKVRLRSSDNLDLAKGLSVALEEGIREVMNGIAGLITPVY
ncbi:MAG: hypothetical protein AB1632_04265 [Nitrospirota bacterium]